MKAIIVLGHRLHNNNLSKVGIQRVEKACHLYKRLHCKMIFSGGQSFLDLKKNKLSESHAMSQYAVKLGVKKKDIVLEEKSFDTFTNALYCRPLIKKYSNVVIVTSKNHLLRAKIAFRLIVGKKIRFIAV